MTDCERVNRMRFLEASAMVAVLALAGCAMQSTPHPLEGRWVGSLDVGDDLRFMRAEFNQTWAGLSGSLDLLGTGRLALATSSYMSTQIFLNMRLGNEVYAFTGESNNGTITGHLHRDGRQLNFRLQQVAEVDRRLLRSYRGTYRVGSELRSIERCVDHWGNDQLLYIEPKTGGRKALFPTSETSFFFGPGYLIPDPIEGRVTFLKRWNGSTYVVWDEAGAEVMIGERLPLDEELKFRPVVRTSGMRHCNPASG
jgi:hypothetical protein